MGFRCDGDCRRASGSGRGPAECIGRAPLATRVVQRETSKCAPPPLLRGCHSKRWSHSPCGTLAPDHLLMDVLALRECFLLNCCSVCGNKVDGCMPETCSHRDPRNKLALLSLLPCPAPPPMSSTKTSTIFQAEACPPTNSISDV